MEPALDPLVPRPLDRPREVPLEPAGDAPGTLERLEELDTGKILAAPSQRSDRGVWREQLHRWREDARSRLGHDRSLYARPDLTWTRTCVVVTQVWIWDELLFDWDRGEFTPDRLLDDAEERFGGFDGVVLWHAYPVIGIDDRNQWDYYDLVPGLRGVVDAMHARGVKVFVDYNPWDTGTRRGQSDAVELTRVVRDLDVDGVFLDTLKEGDQEMLDALSAVRAGVAVEGESTLPLARLVDHSMSWAQWFADSTVPGAVRSRWFEPLHQLHHVRRWNRDHAEELRSAWLNGIGIMVWEVVFGVWVGWNHADCESLRVLSRTFRALPDLAHSEDMEPLVDLGEDVDDAGVVATRFRVPGAQLLCVANLRPEPVEVRLSRPDGERVLNLTTGSECGAGVEAVLRLPGGGIGGLWASSASADRSWLPESSTSPQERSRTFPHRRTTRITPHPSRTSASEDVPTVLVANGEHVLTIRYRCRETGMYDGAPFVDEWKPLPPRLHDQRTLEVVTNLPRPVRVATREVTTAEWAEFVAATHHPWPGASAPNDGLDDSPITGVDLHDARAYATWRGGRLPTEHEWQLASTQPAFERLAPAVWNLTESEHTDGRTRFLMLKGGSDHLIEGSDWYVEPGRRAGDHSLKYLWPGSGLGRSTSIGFRLAWDDPL
jgi:hypothetical protein